MYKFTKSVYTLLAGKKLYEEDLRVVLCKSTLFLHDTQFISKKTFLHGEHNKNDLHEYTSNEQYTDQFFWQTSVIK